MNGIWDRGYWTVARVREVPIRIHWLTPVVIWALGDFRYAPGWWVGFPLLILVHELGHATAVWSFHAEVLTIDLLPFGGQCSWRGNVTPVQRAVIAWGGVLAQAVLFAGTTLALLWFAPSYGFESQLVRVFTRANLYLVALNLLPMKPLDGAEAWPLLSLLWKQRRASAKNRARAEEAAAVRRRRLKEEAERADQTVDELDPTAAREIDDMVAGKLKTK